MGTIVGISFMMGLISSIHCVGMCGPIVLAMPLRDRDGNRAWINGLLYHAGRLTTYTIAGAVAGTLGYSFFAGITQQHLSIVLGILMLIYVLMNWIIKKRNLSFVADTTGFFWTIRQRISSWPLFRNHPSVWVFGLLNGLLPCGVVYLALSSAVATGNVVNGMIHMFFFGLGTAPALLLIGLLGQSLKIRWRVRLQKTVPAMLSLLAILLILRGLNLGIPFISPEFTKANKGCCVKPQ